MKSGTGPISLLFVLLVSPVFLFGQAPDLPSKKRGFDSISLRYAGTLSADGSEPTIIILTCRKCEGNHLKKIKIPENTSTDLYYLVDRMTFGKIVQLFERKQFSGYKGNQWGTFRFTWPGVSQQITRSELIRPEITSTAFAEIAGQVDGGRFLALKSYLRLYAHLFKKEYNPGIRLWDIPRGQRN